MKINLEEAQLMLSSQKLYESPFQTLKQNVSSISSETTANIKQSEWQTLDQWCTPQDRLKESFLQDSSEVTLRRL